MLAVAALAIAAMAQWTDLDLQLAHTMGGSAGFPLRNAWFTKTFGHDWLRVLMQAAGLGLLCVVLFEHWRRRWPAPIRRRMRVLALAAVLVPLLVATLKRLSATHCPWDLQEFGGTEIHVRLFDAAIAGAGAGQCMPAGHASAGLWLLGLVVFWLPGKPRTAMAVAAATLGFGFAIGWIQQLRGAHFLSHTLWSMWIACATVMALWRLLGPKNDESEIF